MSDWKATEMIEQSNYKTLGRTVKETKNFTNATKKNRNALIMVSLKITDILVSLLEILNYCKL